jgi:glycosyltransferase involved in cell wall biosynthesis
MRFTFNVLRSIKRIVKAVLPRETYKRLRKRLLIRNQKVKKNRRSSNKLPCGVNLFSSFNLKSSMDVEGRLLIQALEAAGIPYRTIDVSGAQVDTTKLYNVNLVICHAASETPTSLLRLGIDMKNHYNIGYLAWELAALPDAFCSELHYFQEIWTLSTFCTNAIEKKSAVPVLTVPLCVDDNRTVIENGRDYFHMDKDVFLLAFAFDCNSYVSRKNPQAVVRAFMQAFSPEDRHVGLVLKLSYPEKYKAAIEELLDMLSPYPHIYCIEEYLTEDEMRTLLHIADSVISLHRSEGFGLIPLEAMALGTPVIATAWSGNMEYMHHRNTALVGYTMVPVDGQYVGTAPEDDYVWAEPDTDEAAMHMRRMVSDKAWRESLILHGKHTATACFNTNATGKMIRDRLAFLGLL